MFCQKERNDLEKRFVHFAERDSKVQVGKLSELPITNVCVCVCVCVWERESERQGHVTVESAVLIVACLKHIQASSLSLSHDSVPLSAWTDGKTKDIINCLYIYFES